MTLMSMIDNNNVNVIFKLYYLISDTYYQSVIAYFLVSMYV